MTLQKHIFWDCLNNSNNVGGLCAQHTYIIDMYLSGFIWLSKSNKAGNRRIVTLLMNYGSNMNISDIDILNAQVGISAE